MLDIEHLLKDLSIRSVNGLDALLTWWTTFGYDHHRNRFYAEVYNDNVPNLTAPLMVIQRARLLWFFSVVSQQKKYDHLKKYADIQFHELVNHFYDQNDKGFLWEIDKDYIVLQSRKQTYAQAFCIYALSEYHILTDNEQAKQLALETYELLESKVWDHDNLGYVEALTYNWSTMQDMRLSEKDQNAPKTMNTHLHIVEAYTTLCKIDDSNEIKNSLERVTRLYIDKFYSAETNSFHLFFDNDWNLCSDIISYGHDIESSWLLCEAAEKVGSNELSVKVNELALAVVEKVLKSGFNQDGAVRNEVHNTIADTTYDWWPQAEGAVGFMNAYQINNDVSYLKKLGISLAFIERYFVDHDNGEWHWNLDHDYRANKEVSKSNGWKAPYHNGRLYLEMIHRIKVLKNRKIQMENENITI